MMSTVKETISLENEFIEAEIHLNGLKLSRLYDKATGKDWLWKCNCADDSDNTFDNVWTGGMDIIFPCDEPYPNGGDLFEDHGCLWSRRWTLMNEHNASKTKARFSLISSDIETECVVKLESSAISFNLSVRNIGSQALPYLFRWHPAFPIRPTSTFSVPCDSALCDARFSLPPPKARTFQWPSLPLINGNDVDLSDCGNWADNQMFLCYLKLSEGAFTLSDKESGRCLQANFPLETFPYLTLFASNGGWQNHKMLIAEPSTAPFTGMEEILASDYARSLSPMQSADFSLRFMLS